MSTDVATILLVEDEKPIREFLAQALEDNGHRVLQAIHGRQALSLMDGASPDRPDLVISDVMMPLMGGVELCRRLQADPVTADIPVVLMTAAPALPLLGVGAAATLTKPFDLDQLDALIARLMADAGLPPSGHP